MIYSLADLPLNHVLHGDCVKVLQSLPDECVDFVLADPPFNVSLKYAGYTDNLGDVEYSEWCLLWLKELNRVLKKNHYAVVFTGDKKLYYVFDALMKSGLSFHHFLKWHKPNCQRALSGSVLFGRTELAFLCSNGKPDISLINRRVLYSDTLIYRNTTNIDKDAIEHNARRPLPLYEHLIRGFTKEQDLVLDPFLGSGTTALASIQTGRKYVGVELNAEYVELCNRRIREMEGRGDITRFF